MNWRSLTIAVVVLTTPIFLVSCSSREPRLVPVSGTVTFGGKECPAAGYIYFSAIKTAADTPNQPGSSPFGVDGRFEATTISSGSGLFPGTYRIRIECWKQAPTELAKGISYVPANFAPPDIVIPPNDSKPILLNLDVPAAD